MKHPELVEVIPAFNQFASLDTNENHPIEVHLSARSRETQALSSVCSRTTPPSGNEVALRNNVVDLNHDVGKCIAVRGMEGPEPCRPAQIGAETVHDSMASKQLIDRPHAAPVPDLFKPFANQRNVFGRHRSLPFSDRRSLEWTPGNQL